MHNRGDEDDALSWGDDDPTLETGRPAEARAPEPHAEAPGEVAPSPDEPLAEGWMALGPGSDRVRRERADGDVSEEGPGDGARESSGPLEPEAGPTPARASGNAALIALGVLGGVYLLYTIGWIVGGLRLQDSAMFLVSPAAYVPALWLAVCAPAIWFGSVLVLARKAGAWVRWLWLALGVVLLLPWPFVMIGAVGQ